MGNLITAIINAIEEAKTIKAIVSFKKIGAAFSFVPDAIDVGDEEIDIYNNGNLALTFPATMEFENDEIFGMFLTNEDGYVNITIEPGML